MSTLHAELVQEDAPIAVRVVVRGSATRDAIEHLEGVVRRALQHPAKTVTLDLAQLDFLSSLAIGQFVILASGIRKTGGVIRTVGANPEVATALRRCKVDGVLKLEQPAGATENAP